MRDGRQESITVTNSIIVLRNSLSLSSESSSFGTLCLSAGRYTVTLTLPNNSSAAGARILIKSVSSVLKIGTDKFKIGKTNPLQHTVLSQQVTRTSVQFSVCKRQASVQKNIIGYHISPSLCSNGRQLSVSFHVLVSVAIYTNAQLMLQFQPFERHLSS